MKNIGQNRVKIRKFFIVTLVVLLAMILLMVVVAIYKNNKLNERMSLQSTNIQKEIRYQDYSYINYQGIDYKYKKNIKTLLFMGIDQYRDTDIAGRSDTITLGILNDTEETITLISISRNTVCQVEMVDKVSGETAFYDAQITLQYAYGDGAHESCKLSSDAVSRLLYGIPIDYYFSMDLDGIDRVVDSIGNIPVYMYDDFTHINPLFVKGTTIEMDGDQIESFVRYRNRWVSGGNEERTLRQDAFIKALLEKLREKTEGSTSKTLAIWDELTPYSCTNLNTDQIEKLMLYEMQDVVYKVPGETRSNGDYDEYYVNDELLQELLIVLFYEQVNN